MQPGSSSARMAQVASLPPANKFVRGPGRVVFASWRRRREWWKFAATAVAQHLAVAVDGRRHHQPRRCNKDEACSRDSCRAAPPSREPDSPTESGHKLPKGTRGAFTGPVYTCHSVRPVLCRFWHASSSVRYHMRPWCWTNRHASSRLSESLSRSLCRLAASLLSSGLGRGGIVSCSVSLPRLSQSADAMATLSPGP